LPDAERIFTTFPPEVSTIHPRPLSDAASWEMSPRYLTRI
jgi:hypothetical protein